MRAEERLAALEAGELRPDDLGHLPDAEHGPQDANVAPQRGEMRETKEMTSNQGREPHEPAGDSLVQRWWRRIVGG
jgi:hypothetical protein